MISRLSFFTMFEEQSSRWILWYAVSYVLGVGAFYAFFTPPALAYGLTLLIVCVVLLVIWRYSRPDAVGARALIAPFLFAAAGYCVAAYDFSDRHVPMIAQPLWDVPIQGVLVSVDFLSDQKTKWLLSGVTAQDGKAYDLFPERVRLTVPSQALPPPVGSVVSARVHLLPVSGPAYPGGYDFRRYYFFEGIGAFASLPQNTLPQLVAPPDNAGSGMMAFLANERIALSQRVLAVLGANDTAGLVVALLVGSQSALSPEMREAFRLSGLTHLLSISGVHIGMVAAIVFFSLRAVLALFPYLALRYPIKKYAAVAAFFFALLYTVFVGAPVPAQRSLFMAGLGLLAIVVDRRVLSMRTVAIAAFVVVTIAPYSVLGASFQMSFAAVMSLIAFYETKASKAFHQKDRFVLFKMFGAVLSIVATSALAGLATLAIGLYHFQQINWVGLLSNTIGIPLTGFLIMPSVLLSGFFYLLGLEKPFLHLCGLFASWLEEIARLGAAVPYADIPLWGMPHTLFFILFMGILWLFLWQNAMRYVGVIPIIGALALWWWGAVPSDQILVSEDGRLIAVYDSTAKTLHASAVDADFLLNQWQRRVGAERVMPWGEGASVCADKDPCRFNSPWGQSYVLTTRKSISLFEENAKAESAPTLPLLIAPRAKAGEGPCMNILPKETAVMRGAVVYDAQHPLGLGVYDRPAEGTAEASTPAKWPWQR